MCETLAWDFREAGINGGNRGRDPILRLLPVLSYLSTIEFLQQGTPRVRATHAVRWERENGRIHSWGAGVSGSGMGQAGCLLWNGLSLYVNLAIRTNPPAMERNPTDR